MNSNTPTTSALAQIVAQVPSTLPTGTSDDVNAIVIVRSLGGAPAAWTLTIKDRTCTVEEGETAEPNVALEASAETWQAILDRKLQPTWAAMSGALRIKGDFAMAIRLQSVFML